MFRESCKFSKSYRKGPWSDSGQFCACPHLPSCLCWEKPPSGCRAWHWLPGWEQLSSSCPHPCSLLLSTSECWAWRNTSAKILPPFKPESAYGCGYFNFFLFIFLLYVYGYFISHMSVYHTCAWCPPRPEEVFCHDNSLSSVYSDEDEVFRLGLIGYTTMSRPWLQYFFPFTPLLTS